MSDDWTSREDALGEEVQALRARNLALREALRRVEDQLSHDQLAWEHDHEDAEPWDECRACTYDAMLRDVRQALGPCPRCGGRGGDPEHQGPCGECGT